MPRLSLAAPAYLFLCLGLLPRAGVSLAQSPLSPVEEEIVRFVDEGIDDARALLEQAVNVNSGTMNFEGVREVGRLFADALEEVGLETEWVDGSAFGRAGHLIARQTPAAEADVLHVVLIGHLDTVFEPDSPFQQYEQLDEETARGPGVVDMKGGNVVLIHALDALRRAGVLDGLRITVVLMGDEEKSGRPLDLAREHLIAAAREADVALGFEDGDGNPATAVIARRGAFRWDLRVSGTPAHSSLIFQEGVGAGAIFEAARVLNGLRDSLSADPLLSLNPGLILGGTEIADSADQERGTAFGKRNVIARDALVTGDLRPISPEQLEAAQATMQRVASNSLPGTSSQVTFSDGYPPMPPMEGNRDLLALYDQVSRDLGLGAVDAVNPREAGAADIAFAAAHVQRAMDGLGLMGTAGHTVNETADLRTLPTQTRRAAILLYRLSLGH